ncbi:MAG: aspartate-semialdehyde dehydrogenase [Chlamydiales bacterium]|nr:aspartate-semialdehyde dehydrogenase [Chlamydiales bacterium]
MRVGLLGRSGQIAQKYLELLKHHPWFELTFVASRDGEQLGTLPDCALLFSALPGKVAEKWEPYYVEHGYTVISSASYCRLNPKVPLVIPELNAHLLKGHTGLIAKPNCSLQSYVLPLGFLHQHFGIEKVHVTTLQAISGAGANRNNPAFIENVVPYIQGEEEKCEQEPLKILGNDIVISAHCNRVFVQEGHLANVSVSFRKKPSRDEILKVWNEAPSLDLPSAPRPLFRYFEQEDRPQPRYDLDPMQISIGRLRPCPLLDWRFSALSHNTMRGGAGGGVLIGEVIYHETQSKLRQSTQELPLPEDAGV